LNTSSSVTWVVALILSGGTFFATRKSLGQLNEAWESANAISKDEQT